MKSHPLGKHIALTAESQNHTKPTVYERYISRLYNLKMATFTIFPRLPPELRAKIWDKAFSSPRIVHIDFNRQVSYQKSVARIPGRRARRAHVHYSFKMRERYPPPEMTSISPEARAEWVRLHPHSIRLNQGPPIHFNQDRDTIYFDPRSFYWLWYYAVPFLRSGRSTRTGLRGFPDVRILGSFLLATALGNDRNPNVASIGELREPCRGVFSGLTRIRLLGHQSILPWGYIPLTPATITTTVRGSNDAQYMSLSLRVRPAQVSVVMKASDDEMHEVDHFWHIEGPEDQMSLEIGP